MLASAGAAGLSSDGVAGLVAGAPASTVIRSASWGVSGRRNGDIHHTAAIASPCSPSASPNATGDIRLDLE